MARDRLVKTNGTYITWGRLIEAVRDGAEGLAVGELATRDAERLAGAADIILHRLNDKAARDIAKGGG